MPNNSSNNSSKIIAIVGMPGAGKSEVVSFLKQKGIQAIRFGDTTEETVKKMGLPLTPESEQKVREDLRKEFGMNIFAVKSLIKIQQALAAYHVVIIDGLYSWEEYVFLIKEFPELLVVHVYSERQIRYERLIKRAVRPFSLEEGKARDMAEIEKLHKSGPIAIADYLVENNETKESLYQKIEELLARLTI